MRRLLAGVLACLAAGAAAAETRTTVDPGKRATISTSNAMRPSAAQFKGDGVIGGRVIPMTTISTTTAAVGNDRAAIDVSESRDKVVIESEARSFPVRESERDSRRRAGDMQAAIPRLSRERFQKILSEYAKGRVPARTMLNAAFASDGAQPTIGEINRYANPRRALEGQGIPVITAGEDAAPRPASNTVPVSQDRR